VQLQSDQHTDRVNLDAPDGYDDTELVRQFARLHDAGSLRAVFYPSTDEVRSGDPQQLSLSREGDRVPIEHPSGVE
jgi:putative intracellular protease/amidase